MKWGIVIKIRPNINSSSLVKKIKVFNEEGDLDESFAVIEKPLAIYLNDVHIVTAMTIGDYPEYLAVGFLRNQGMLHFDDDIKGIDYDAELETVVVRTSRKTNYEEKLSRKTRTSGCAVGTVFGDIMEGLDNLTLSSTPLKTSWLYTLANQINQT